MFVPRALRIKGVKETQRRKPETTTPDGSSLREDALVQATQKASTNSAATSPAPLQSELEKRSAVSSQAKANTSASSEHLAQLAAGIELIFTDYAHQHTNSANWLHERYRTIEAGEKYVHLTAILDHPNIATLKPQATQMLLRQALNENPCHALELSENGFYVRRRPSTYPASFVPANSFDIVNDDGLSFWDQRTIYVEPHIRHLCKTPAKVAHWLKKHGQLKAKWLPVQAVYTLYNSCAFVVLSGNVMHEDQWKKWRANERPKDWRVMTKVDNLKRTEEYIALKAASEQRSSQPAFGDDGQHVRRSPARKRPLGSGDTDELDRATRRRL